MRVCVAIEIDESGAVMVGAIPPGEYGDAMQPVKSVEEAFAVARDLLGGGGADQGQAQEAGFQSVYGPEG